MNRQTVERGTLVAFHERDFDEFKDTQGRTVPAGTTRTAFLVSDTSQPPTSIKVRPEHANGWQDLIGQQVEVVCDAFANNNRIELRAASAAKALTAK